MSSYAASARIVATRPHLRAIDAGAELLPAGWVFPSVTPVPSVEADPPPTLAGPVIDLIDDDPSTWFERVSTGWGQLTWYLFNAEGWR
jgi:hypothetical protein